MREREGMELQLRDRHCKFYAEKELVDRVVDFQERHHLYSFSAALRELVLIGLAVSGPRGLEGK